MSLFTSENQIVCFPSFVLTVFWCSTSYTVLIVFWMMLMEPVDAPARWWPCACLKCVSGLRRLKKPWTFSEMHKCLWPGAQIWFTHKWRKLFTASLLFLCIDGYSCLRYWNAFFFSCVSCFRLKFSRTAFWRKRMQLDFKSDWPWKVWFLGFLLENGFFRRPHICMEWNLQELLNCCSFLTTPNFFDV